MVVVADRTTAIIAILTGSWLALRRECARLPGNTTGQSSPMSWLLSTSPVYVMVRRCVAGFSAVRWAVFQSVNLLLAV